MGLESRDYVRRDDRGGWSGASSQGLFSTAVKTLIVINIAVFVLQLLITRPVSAEGAEAYGHLRDSLVEDWFRLDPIKVFFGQIWRLTTYDFLHNRFSVWHIFWNMYILWAAGQHLEEGVLGRKEFLAFYLVAGVISGICYLLWCVVMGQMVPAIGASGAVAAVMLFYALRFPDHVWRIFWVLPVPVLWIAMFNVIVDLHPVLLQLGGEAYHDGVAHAAHLGGMAFGFLCHRYDWRIMPLVDRINWHPVKAYQRWKARRRFKVVRDDEPRAKGPASPSLEAELDRVLAKVHASGQDSLTPAERETLIDASRRLKKP